eukprot:TRINITY_DN19546_c0_g1_i1.p1 TRINITY_DN19546_c0_g1~~TRINITY_DN19546_c0_g1_i1.p1  ORF type:complete len:232 (-),score=77.66 TRINITY_DN19546_c0_g1_i1:41-736(-)
MSSKQKQPAPKKQKTQPAKIEKKEETPAPVHEENPAQPEELKEYRTIQERIDTIDEKAAAEIVAVEKKSRKEKEPIYAERAAALKKIPHFWKHTLINHGVLSQVISEADTKILDHLEDMKVEEWDDDPSPEGFRITMYFSSGNTAFSNREISKEFHLQPDSSVQIKAVAPKWKGKEPKDTFFAWFNDQDETSDEIASILRDDIWPDPTISYLGMMPGDLGDEEDEDEEGDE